MKKLNIVISLLLLVFFLNSCKNEKSLQVYFVESSEKESFMYGDIPVGLMLTPKEKASDEVKKTVKSIKKINVLFLKNTKDNDAAFEIVKEKLKIIYNNK